MAQEKHCLITSVFRKYINKKINSKNRFENDRVGKEYSTYMWEFHRKKKTKQNNAYRMYKEENSPIIEKKKIKLHIKAFCLPKVITSPGKYSHEISGIKRKIHTHTLPSKPPEAP